MNEVPHFVPSMVDYGCRLRAGVLVPSGNSVAEPELKAMLPPGVSTLVTRLALRGSSEGELMGMIDGLEAAAELLADAGVEVIVFHCTAVSTFAPDLAERIRERIEKTTGVRSFTTSDAILAALAGLRVRQVSLLTPYIDDVHGREIEFLAANGVRVIGGANLGIATNTEMAKLEPEAILAWARANVSGDADACFLSCTAIKSAAMIESLEHSSGRPVITSNQSMAWHLIRSSGLADPITGFGKLFEVNCATGT